MVKEKGCFKFKLGKSELIKILHTVRKSNLYLLAKKLSLFWRSWSFTQNFFMPSGTLLKYSSEILLENPRFIGDTGAEILSTLIIGDSLLQLNGNDLPRCLTGVDGKE